MIYIILTYIIAPLIYILVFFKRNNEVKRILVIQTAKIGDLICSTPVFRAIKRKYPHASLSVMANPLTIELLKFNPYVDEIISLQSSFYKGFTGKIQLSRLFSAGKYDIALCLNPNVPYTIAMFWALIPVRVSIMPDFVGITYRLTSVLSTYLARHKRGRLVAETYMEMLKAIGIDSSDIAKDVFKSPDAEERVETLLASNLKPQTSKLVGIAVTSGNKLKEWGAEKMAALSERLTTELDVRIILIGSEKDKDISDRIQGAIHHKDTVIDAVGKFSLAELPALIEKLSLFIGVDTGIIYIADALNIPVIDIAGPSDMEDQRPTGKKAIIIQKKDINCVPCSHSFNTPYECRYGHRECITTITVEEVFQSASRLLA